MKCPGTTRKGRPCTNRKAKGRPTCGRCVGPLPATTAPVAATAALREADPFPDPAAQSRRLLAEEFSAQTPG